ncbi:MAG: hypothetical protein V1817_03565, partial [Candidatus Micrarchaeota archaeon]
VSNLSASNTSSCVAGVGTKIIVKRVIRLIETPDGVRTRVDLIVSNVGNETAFGVSVNEGLSRVVDLKDVEFAVTPNLVAGGAEWVISSLAPGDSKTFSYYVSRRLSESEIARLSAPLVQADSFAASAAAQVDYSLFYAAGVAFALALLTAAVERFRKH